MFFLFTETEIIEEFTEPVAVETTEVGLILRVFVWSLDYSFETTVLMLFFQPLLCPFTVFSL